MLDISIHISKKISSTNVINGEDSKIKKIGQRLKVIRDIPNVESYIQLEMPKRERSVAVTGKGGFTIGSDQTNTSAVSGHARFREEVRRQVIKADRLNVQLFLLDFQPKGVDDNRGGTAA